VSSDVIRLMEVGLEQVPRMEHPRDARFVAMARPMPREAPVMTAILPERSWSRRRGEDITEARAVWISDVSL